MNELLISFLSAFYAEKECWINPDILIDIDTDGFVFKPDKRIKGLLVFGDKYPLSNMDCSLNDHHKVRKAIRSVHVFGSAYTNAPSGMKGYYHPNT